jgi:hypothetical protein
MLDAYTFQQLTKNQPHKCNKHIIYWNPLLGWHTDDEDSVYFTNITYCPWCGKKLSE